MRAQRKAAVTNGKGATYVQRLSTRQFFKRLVGAAVGLAALAPRAAEATYTAGTPDVVNTDLEVQGTLNVRNGAAGPSRLNVNAATGDVGIGTTTPGAKLEVAGAIRVNGVPAIDASAVAVQSYYAP